MIMEQNPQFFKIILDDTIRKGKLRLPRKFAKKYVNSLSSPVTLEVPSVAKWQVELLKCDGEVWLAKGYQEFSRYYTLKFGHFLVFKYVEVSHFHVIILDATGSEIEYPFEAESNLDGSPENQTLEKNVDGTSVEVLHNPSPCQKMGDQSLLPRSCENAKTNGKVRGMKTRSGASSSSTTSRAHEAANHFTSKYPFFKVKLLPTHFGSSNVTIPKQFCVRHIEQIAAGNAMLEVGDRMWGVKFIHSLSNNTITTVLGGGWRAFAKENSLEAGDVCAFQLIKANVFRVSIFRNVN